MPYRCEKRIETIALTQGPQNNKERSAPIPHPALKYKGMRLVGAAAGIQ